MRVLIVDDHPLVRKGIMATLSLDESFTEVLEASTLAEAMRQMTDNKVDIAVIDIYLGYERGLDLVTRCRNKNMDTKFVVLTSSLKREDFIKAQEINVDGYILKEAFAEDIIYALRVVARGKKYVDSELIRYNTALGHDSGFEQLTEREKDVLLQLGKGYTNVQIAERLYISENTVKKHVSSILSKLQLRCRTEAAIYANNDTIYSH